jgi:hypothetical protein
METFPLNIVAVVGRFPGYCSFVGTAIDKLVFIFQLDAQFLYSVIYELH